jgi:signal transduction histidine kinase
MLERLAAVLDPTQVPVTVRWIAADCAARTLMSDIDHAATRIHELVGSVKRFTYMDRGNSTQMVDVAQGIRDTVAVHRSAARAKEVGVSIEIPDDISPVLASGGDLNQIWSNLLENAIYAVAPGGHVAISARQIGSELTVEIVDDGPGIPAEQLERIFDPFVTTKPVGHGTGLGLDIARRLARLNDGEITVESTPGRTAFRVRLGVVVRS